MSTKLDFQLELLVYQGKIESSFFKNVAKHNFFLFLLYSAGHQVQYYFHLDKSIASSIRKLDTCNHTMCLIVPLCGVLAILKNKKKFDFFYIANPLLYVQNIFTYSFTSKLRKIKWKDKKQN